MSPSNSEAEVLVVYDKQCPACDYYCNLVRIRESVGRLVLVDARDGGPIMEEITAKGLDIDQGMVVKVGEQLYYGSDAIHALALMGTNRGLFNRLAYWSFRSRRYPGSLPNAADLSQPAAEGPRQDQDQQLEGEWQ